LDAAYKLAPSNPDVNYLMGYLFYQQKDPAQAQSYLTTAANISSRNVRVLTLLGNLQLTQKNYAGAAASLEKAVDTESGNWMAHNLLASAYLGLKKYEPARQEAEMAIAQRARLRPVRQTWFRASAGESGEKSKKVSEALQASSGIRPRIQSAPQVLNLIAKVEGHDSNPVPEPVKPANGRAILLWRRDPLFIAPELPVAVNPWRPPGIDESKPSTFRKESTVHSTTYWRCRASGLRNWWTMCRG
jgi:tetratricopeptide (TPR) repeat protein